jgi:hypothetical protein
MMFLRGIELKAKGNAVGKAEDKGNGIRNWASGP